MYRRNLSLVALPSVIETMQRRQKLYVTMTFALQRRFMIFLQDIYRCFRSVGKFATRLMVLLNTLPSLAARRVQDRFAPIIRGCYERVTSVLVEMMEIRNRAGATAEGLA